VRQHIHASAADDVDATCKCCRCCCCCCCNIGFLATTAAAADTVVCYRFDTSKNRVRVFWSEPAKQPMQIYDTLLVAGDMPNRLCNPPPPFCLWRTAVGLATRRCRQVQAVYHKPAKPKPHCAFSGSTIPGLGKCHFNVRNEPGSRSRSLDLPREPTPDENLV
jgi:hypothetical protein